MTYDIVQVLQTGNMAGGSLPLIALFRDRVPRRCKTGVVDTAPFVSVVVGKDGNSETLSKSSRRWYRRPFVLACGLAVPLLLGVAAVGLREQGWQTPAPAPPFQPPKPKWTKPDKEVFPNMGFISLQVLSRT